jgi:hypothetical protein
MQERGWSAPPYLGDDLERDLRLGVPVLVRVQLQRCVRVRPKPRNQT